MNTLINNIINEKKNLMQIKTNIFLNKFLTKTGYFMRIDYEHLPFPMPKTKKILITKHQFLGLCISKKNKNLASTLVIRNVIKKHPIEAKFFIYSPLIENFDKIRAVKNKFSFRKSKLYFLNQKPLKYSRLRLDFDKKN